MTNINKTNNKGLTAEKKIILKNIIGSASSIKIDLNKLLEIVKKEF